MIYADLKGIPLDSNTSGLETFSEVHLQRNGVPIQIIMLEPFDHTSGLRQSICSVLDMTHERGIFHLQHVDD